MATATELDPLSSSSLYLRFGSSISKKTISLDRSDQEVWTIYDAGPKVVKSPLICLPPVCGTADCFYQIMMALSAKGYRVISVDYPIFWSAEAFCVGFEKLLNELKLDQVHLFGASLGGFLAQKFVEKCYKNHRVCSQFLCNSFCDTTVFNQSSTAKYLKFQPAFLLKRQILINLPSDKVESRIADSIDFMVERLDGLDRSQLASRLTMNCTGNFIDPSKVKDVYTTIMDVNDNSVLTNKVKDELIKLYPSAKRAHLKNGGNFPYLSRSDEVNLHLQIHLRTFFPTRYCPVDPDTIDPDELRIMKGNVQSEDSQAVSEPQSEDLQDVDIF